MMRWHRLCVGFLAPLLIYIVVTGAGIQLADMSALVSKAPENNPDMLMMRQHISGPDNYSVVRWPDYTAAPLPANLDYVEAVRKAAALGRAAAPGADLRLVELRMVRGRVAAHVQMGERQLMFDLATGATVPATDLPPAPPGRDFPAARASFKFLHRFNYLGQIGTSLNLVAGIGFAILIFTGLVHYVRLYRMRVRLRKTALAWRAGGWWRDLHRWTAMVAGVLVIWITASGLLLSLDNVGAFVHGLTQSRPTRPNVFDGDLSSPLNDAELAGMTRTTLVAFKRTEPATALKVLRLRYFAEFPQGVVIAADAATSQLVFNAATGSRMAMWEKGYPDLGFPSGWEWHQKLKQIHRGDIFGMPGRWLDTFGGLALLYLSLSGAVMYLQLWSRRRKAGRAAWLWRR